MCDTNSLFQKQKELCLSGIDWSRKGSVDGPITEVVKFINGSENYFTTSSCSGRIMVFENSNDVVQKKGCKWLYTTHESATGELVMDSIKNATGNAVFKFEPFVLHVQCKLLEHAQKLHSVAVASGFRNSGITVGTKGKIITAVRSTHSMEVPLSDNGNILVSDQYIDFLVKCANEKLEENFNRIERFFTNYKEMINSPDKQLEKELKKQQKKELKQAQDKLKQKTTLDTQDVDDDNLNFFCFDET
ncbi:tRNA wybutosine-synthesizing protein 3 homolog [Patella vulgata]|uniref:tRNA wybutosine-synthesizing protein 3 homolog n=1 Tax=Patella vulgata TaxID=6465 RepID=UPI00217FFDC3|nr:tRNA wybutosine-synthesizing protein 3 homolog [Patella vulgata]